MIYFKKIAFGEDVDRQQFEQAIRKFTSKRTASLDFLSAISNVGLSKYFIGNDGKRAIKFTRIRTSFEKILPKLIVSFPKNEEFNYYKIRLSVPSTIVLFFLVVLSFATIPQQTTITNPEKLGILCALGIYVLFIFLEIKLTDLRIKKAIQKSIESIIFADNSLNNSINYYSKNQ